MTRYFFHLIGDGERVVDTTGVELPSEDAALREAERGVRDMLAEDLQSGGAFTAGWVVEVTDGTGLTRLTVTFDNILTQAMRRRDLP